MQFWDKLDRCILHLDDTTEQAVFLYFAVYVGILSAHETSERLCAFEIVNRAWNVE